MPEGDTIFRAAAALRVALVGRPTVRFEAPRLRGPRPGPGQVIERVVSHGKHLEIEWADGVVLHTHMRMSGSWHLYRPGERWRASPSRLRALVEVPDFVAVCFAAPVVETYRSPRSPTRLGTSLPPTRALAALGPDLCDPDADLGACVERMTVLGDPVTTAAEVLLDQRICCGVGNVFKSEVLWACGLDPFARLTTLEEPTRHALVATAAAMLQANLTRVDRTTTDRVPGGLAVYGRAGRPCPRCGTAVRSRRHGEQARVTYWCPQCQR